MPRDSTQSIQTSQHLNKQTMFIISDLSYTADSSFINSGYCKNVSPSLLYPVTS